MIESSVPSSEIRSNVSTQLIDQSQWFKRKANHLEDQAMHQTIAPHTRQLKLSTQI
jgi:hypothetical protein